VLKVFVGMRIQEIGKCQDFFSLKEEWTAMLGKCDHTVFSTWEWLSIWWKHFGNDKRLVLLLAEENDKIVGIAPLMYSVHRLFGLRQGRIEFIGTPDSDYNDFVLTNQSEERIKLFISYLNNLPEKWDCIDLMDIPQKSKTLQVLSSITRNVKPAHKCPFTSLPRSPDTYLMSLPRKHRKELNRNVRVMEREGFKIDFVDCSDSQSLEEGMNGFFELHQRRWKSKGLPGVFEDQRIHDFNLEIAKIFSQNGWLGLYLLKLSDKPVAALYGFKYLSKYYAYLSGFDPQYSKYGVGSLLFMFAINKCIQEGLTEFDFMRGAEEYKDRWNTMARWTQEATLVRKGFWTSFENWLYNEYWHQGNRLKYIMNNAPRTLARALNR
jgi:CelD/BcsL family acetyltransferase involved in cellulose biosynthesis